MSWTLIFAVFQRTDMVEYFTSGYERNTCSIPSRSLVVTSVFCHTGPVIVKLEEALSSPGKRLNPTRGASTMKPNIKKANGTMMARRRRNVCSRKFLSTHLYQFVTLWITRIRSGICPSPMRSFPSRSSRRSSFSSSLAYSTACGSST